MGTVRRGRVASVKGEDKIFVPVTCSRGESEEVDCLVIVFCFVLMERSA